MKYTHTISITLPASLADIAAKIGKSMDDDIGGERSFSPVVTGTDEAGEPVYGDTIRTSAMCTEAFYYQAQYMLAHHEALYQACQADYATRWPDLVPPTLEECEAFCSGVIQPSE